MNFFFQVLNGGTVTQSASNLDDLFVITVDEDELEAGETISFTRDELVSLIRYGLLDTLLEFVDTYPGQFFLVPLDKEITREMLFEYEERLASGN